MKIDVVVRLSLWLDRQWRGGWGVSIFEVFTLRVFSAEPVSWQSIGRSRAENYVNVIALLSIHTSQAACYTWRPTCTAGFHSASHWHRRKGWHRATQLEH
jgi:hypothetical protein